MTVTHREATRLFMTIPEASQLILQAMVLGQGGEIFVLDMGEPVRISYLAEQLIRLSGLEPYKDIDIVYTAYALEKNSTSRFFTTKSDWMVRNTEKFLRRTRTNVLLSGCATAWIKFPKPVP